MPTIDDKNYKQIKKKRKIFLSKNLIDEGCKKAERNIWQYIKSIWQKQERLTQNNQPKYRIALTFTYNRTLPNVKETVKKHWNILQINNKFEDLFSEPLVMCFYRSNIWKTFFGQNQWSKKAQKVKLWNRKGNSMSLKNQKPIW